MGLNADPAPCSIAARYRCQTSKGLRSAGSAESGSRERCEIIDQHHRSTVAAVDQDAGKGDGCQIGCKEEELEDPDGCSTFRNTEYPNG